MTSSSPRFHTDAAFGSLHAIKAWTSTFCPAATFCLLSTFDISRCAVKAARHRCLYSLELSNPCACLLQANKHKGSSGCKLCDKNAPVNLIKPLSISYFESCLMHANGKAEGSAFVKTTHKVVSSNNLALCLWQSYTSSHQVLGNFKNIIHLYRKMINHWTFGGKKHKFPYSDLKVHLKKHHLLYQFIYFRLIVQRGCIFKHHPMRIRQGFSNMTETTVPLHCKHWRQLSDIVVQPLYSLPELKLFDIWWLCGVFFAPVLRFMFE